MSRPKILSESEINDVVALYEDGMYSSEIAKKYDISPATIRNYLSERGIKRTGQGKGARLNSNDTKNICQKYKKGKSSNELAAKYNITIPAIIGLLERRNIDRRPQKQAQRKYNFNENVFENVNEESAYWVGFIMADGCIYKRNGSSPSLTITLSEADGEHLKRFRQFLSSDHPIRRLDNRGYGGAKKNITIYSDKIANDLRKFGIKPRKSSTAKVRILENNRHFWRGVIDGDGYVKNGEKENARLELVGSEPLLEQFSDYCYIISGIKLNVHPHRSIYRISCSWGTAKNILNHLYQKGDLCLKRKWQ